MPIVFGCPFGHDGYIVGLFRLGAPIPATIQNYVFGLTRIGIWSDILATVLGALPHTILYLCLGAVGRMTLSGPSRLDNIVAMVVSTAITPVVTLRVSTKAKAALAETMAPPPGDVPDR